MRGKAKKHIYMHTYVYRSRYSISQAYIGKNGVSESLIISQFKTFKSQVKNSFFSITTKTLAAHNTLLTARNYSLLIGHGIAESHPLYIYVYTAGVGVLLVTVTRNLLLAIQMLSLSAVKYSPGAIQTVALYYVTATVLSLPNIGSTHSSL